MSFQVLIVIEGKKEGKFMGFINKIKEKIESGSNLSEHEKLIYADFLVNKCPKSLKESYPTITKKKNSKYNEMNVSLEELREKEFEEE